MVAPAPAYIVRHSPNQSGPMGQVRGIVVHGTRSGHAMSPTEGEGTVNFCLRPGTTSYNWIVDRDGTQYELVPPGSAAWHAGYLNWHYLGIGLAQGVVDDPITPEQHRSARALIDRWTLHYGIPKRRILFLDRAAQTLGITQHMDTQQGRDYGKSDVGYRLDWSQLL